MHIHDSPLLASGTFVGFCCHEVPTTSERAYLLCGKWRLSFSDEEMLSFAVDGHRTDGHGSLSSASQDR